MFEPHMLILALSFALGLAFRIWGWQNCDSRATTLARDLNHSYVLDERMFMFSCSNPNANAKPNPMNQRCESRRCYSYQVCIRFASEFLNTDLKHNQTLEIRTELISGSHSSSL